MQEPSDRIPDIHFESLSRLETTYWWHLARLDWAETVIRRHFPEPACLNVLDYGCGTGGFLYELDRRLCFRSTLGVDISPKAVALAKRYGDHYGQIKDHGTDVVRGRDLVLLMDVIEHVEDDLPFLRGIAEGMQEGAHVLITVPAMPILYSEWDKTLGHYRRYTIKGLKDLAADAGLKVVSVGYFHFLLSFVVYIRRSLLKAKFSRDTCEFPPVHPAVNRLLIVLGKIELILGKHIKYPAGNSIICLLKK